MSEEPLKPSAAEPSTFDIATSLPAATISIAARGPEPSPARRDAPTTKLGFAIDEELGDQQSNTFAYRFVIRNEGTEPVDILSIEPRVPEAVRLLHVKNSAVIEADTRRAQLAEELTNLLGKFLFAKVKAFGDLWTRAQRERFNEVISGRGFLTFYLRAMTGSMKRYEERWQREFNVVKFAVRTFVDAQRAYEKWLSTPDADTKEISDLFLLKMQQLKSAEAESGGAQSLARVDPGATLEATYILRAPRSWFEPRKYQFTIDVTYQSAGQGIRTGGGATRTLLVRPHAIPLSVVAVAFSALGVAAKALIAPEKLMTKGAANWVELVQVASGRGWFLLAAIVAVVFFNIYDYTQLGKKFSEVPLSWRSALVIGFLSGLSNDQILAAIRAFLGSAG